MSESDSGHVLSADQGSVATPAGETFPWLSGQPQPSSVVNCVAYSRSTGLPVVELPLCDVSEALESDPDLYVWIGLFEPTADTLAEVQHEFGLHELAIEDASREYQRPKLESYDDCLFVVVRTAQIVDQRGSIDFGTTYFFLGERYLISIRKGASLSYQTVRKACEHNPARMKLGPGYVFYTLLDFIVDNYLPITDQLTVYLGKLENDIFSGKFNRQTLRHLYDLKSELVSLKLAIVPLQEVSGYFTYRKEDELAIHFPATALPYFRDVQDHILRTLDAVEAISAMLGVAMDTYLALVGVDQNEIVKRLASWAGILAVPTMIASFYGMNFDNMPELHWHYGYFIMLGIMFVVTLLVYRKLKRVKWL